MVHLDFILLDLKREATPAHLALPLARMPSWFYQDPTTCWEAQQDPAQQYYTPD